jgi:tetrahydromethanopterin S-methyltransferase subunit B
VYVVTLNAGAKTAAVAPFFAGNATATAVNGSNAGKKVTLALTDPDSNLVVPSSSPKFAGDFMLNSQGDEELIFSDVSGQNLQVLKISNSVDDIAWATSATGTLYTTDSSADTVNAITGPFTPGTAYTAVTPCNANSAPTTCPAPGFPANSLGMIDLTTGAVSNVTIGGVIAPKGMVFVP